MQTFGEFWVNLSATPLFGLTATVVVYVLAQSVSHRLNHQPLSNPVLWTLAGLAALLMLGLLALPAVREPVEAAADAMLQHLSLLFVPVGVGVITNVAILAEYGLRIGAVLLLSTVAGLAVTACLLQALLRPKRLTGDTGGMHANLR